MSNRRSYYGIYCPYGIRTISAGGYAIAFDTGAERDAWVAGDEWRGGDYHRKAATADYIKRHRVPILTESGPSRVGW